MRLHTASDNVPLTIESLKSLSKNELKISVKAHFDRFSPQNLKNHQLYVLATLSLRHVGLFLLDTIGKRFSKHLLL